MCVAVWWRPIITDDDDVCVCEESMHKFSRSRRLANGNATDIREYLFS